MANYSTRYYLWKVREKAGKDPAKSHPVNILSFELGRKWRALEIIEIQTEIHVTRLYVRVITISN